MGGPREGADSQERVVLAAVAAASHISPVHSQALSLLVTMSVCPTRLSLLATKGLCVLAAVLSL